MSVLSIHSYLVKDKAADAPCIMPKATRLAGTGALYLCILPVLVGHDRPTNRLPAKQSLRMTRLFPRIPLHRSHKVIALRQVASNARYQSFN